VGPENALLMESDRDQQEWLSQAIVASLALPVLFVVVYFGCGQLTASRADVGTVAFDWERHIPLIEWLIVPYLSLDILFVAAIFVSDSRGALHILIKRLVLAILLGGIGFVLWPLRGPDPGDPRGPFAFAYHLLWRFDPSYNSFPSLHVAITLILWLHVKGRRPRILIHLWFALVLVSPLLTRRHNLIDIVGGFMLAGICLFIVPGQINSSRLFFSRRKSRKAPGPNSHSAAVAPNATPVQVPRWQ